MRNKLAIGEKVRELRKRSGLSQDDFAKELGYSRNYVSQVELGNKTPGARFERDMLTFEQTHFGVATMPEPTLRTTEDPPDMECPIMTDSPPARGAEKYFLELAAHCNAEELSALISKVTADKATPLPDRHALLQRLNALFTRTLAAERGEHQRKN